VALDKKVLSSTADWQRAPGVRPHLSMDGTQAMEVVARAAVVMAAVVAAATTRPRKQACSQRCAAH